MDNITIDDEEQEAEDMEKTENKQLQVDNIAMDDEEQKDEATVSQKGVFFSNIHWIRGLITHWLQDQQKVLLKQSTAACKQISVVLLNSFLFLI